MKIPWVRNSQSGRFILAPEQDNIGDWLGGSRGELEPARPPLPPLPPLPRRRPFAELPVATREALSVVPGPAGFVPDVVPPVVTCPAETAAAVWTPQGAWWRLHRCILPVDHVGDHQLTLTWVGKPTCTATLTADGVVYVCTLPEDHGEDHGDQLQSPYPRWDRHLGVPGTYPDPDPDAVYGDPTLDNAQLRDCATTEVTE